MQIGQYIGLLLDIKQWGKVAVGYNNFPISFTRNVLAAVCTDSGNSVITYGINVQGLNSYIAYTKISDESFWGYGLFVGI